MSSILSTFEEAQKYRLAVLPEASKQFSKFRKKVHIVDDDREITEVLRATLERARMDVCVAHDPYEAMSMLNDTVFDMVVLDWHLPKLNGLKTIIEAEKLFRFDPSIPLEWDGKKVRVVTFSSDETTHCKFPSTRHFKYMGHIHKKNTLATIMEKLGFFLNKNMERAA